MYRDCPNFDPMKDFSEGAVYSSVNSLPVHQTSPPPDPWRRSTGEGTPQWLYAHWKTQTIDRLYAHWKTQTIDSGYINTGKHKQ